MLLMFYYTEWNQENTYKYNTVGKHMLSSLERCLEHLKTTSTNVHVKHSMKYMYIGFAGQLKTHIHRYKSL
jgi:hypothetical protein